MTNNFNKLKEFENVHYELMENAIPTIDVIEKINNVILKLETTRNTEHRKKYIKDFYKEVENWQILISKPKDNLVWMQIPMKYYEVTREFTFAERMKVLINRGIWIQPKITERYADMVSNTKYPMEIPLNLMNFLSSTANSEEKFYYTINNLMVKIVAILSESDSIAVYEKPYGIVAMNKVNYWITQLGKKTRVDISHLQQSLETIPFSDLIRKSSISIINREEATMRGKSLVRSKGFNKVPKEVKT